MFRSDPVHTNMNQRVPCVQKDLIKLYQRWPQIDVEIFNYIVHANLGTQSGRQVWETSVGDKWETSVNLAQRTQSGRQVWETSVRQV